MLEMFILTGLSGAGKTFANKCLEDVGFYCVDNLPPALIPHFAQLCANSTRKMEKLSLVIDIRGGEFFDELFKSLDTLDQANFKYNIVFLDASNEALIRRYKETRRQHPLSPKSNGDIQEAIRIEREMLKRIKDRADFYIDTSNMNNWALKQEITRTLLGNEKARNLKITIISFGYKYGIPLEADLVFDIRFLPNPYYEENLKKLSGENEEVYEFVLKSPITTDFISKVSDMVLFMLPHTIAEGKSDFVISFGCTGGHHRSVVMAIEFCRILTQRGYDVTVRHRDISAGG